MPIYLGPLTRRQFLARSLAALAGMALLPEIRAASRKAADSNCWALLSDIHIAGDPAFKARNVNVTEHFTVACRQVLELPNRPAGLFIAGDCAYNSGQPEDYAQMARLIDAVRAGQLPVHLALGNHDARDQFSKVFPETVKVKNSPAEKRVALVKADRVNWFVLDSLEKTLSTPGLLGQDQLDWLAATLDGDRRKPAVVIAHHNPGLEGGNVGLKDTLALLEILRPRKQVKAFVFGHTHTWSVEQDPSGIHLVNLPAVAYVFREGEPSGWVEARVERKQMTLKLHCIDAGHQRNGETVNLSWRT